MKKKMLISVFFSLLRRRKKTEEANGKIWQRHHNGVNKIKNIIEKEEKKEGRNFCM